ncbi:MAG: hypothetical protein ACOYW7_01730 [Nitrospirota bacterium]
MLQGSFRQNVVPGVAAFLLSLLCLIVAMNSSTAAAEHASVSILQEKTGSLTIPREYGEIIYRQNEASPRHLYIIGMSHRDALTRANRSTTPRAQAEAYKIGEWLVQKEGLNLLLPEGYFAVRSEGREAAAGYKSGSEQRMPGPSGSGMDIATLESQLADTTRYITAEMLLSDHYHLKLRQVEDRELYDAVYDSLRRLEQGANNDPFLKSELDYLQERRTAIMLQKIPELIELEFVRGAITSKKALLTIGLNHIPEVIKYLKEKRIAIYCPLFTSVGYGDYISEVNLCKGDFGVTVIIPRTVMDDREVLVMTRLNELVMQRESSFPPLIR